MGRYELTASRERLHARVTLLRATVSAESNRRTRLGKPVVCVPGSTALFEESRPVRARLFREDA